MAKNPNCDLLMIIKNNNNNNEKKTQKKNQNSSLGAIVLCTFEPNMGRSDENWGSLLDLKKKWRTDDGRMARYRISSADHVSRGAKNE